MYIVTIREKGKDKPLLERECDCALGAFGSAGEAHFFKTLETQFPGLMDKAVEVAKYADVVEMEIKKPFASLFSRLFGR